MTGSDAKAETGTDGTTLRAGVRVGKETSAVYPAANPEKTSGKQARNERVSDGQESLFALAQTGKKLPANVKWTQKREDQFFAALAMTGCVTAAAAAAGLPRPGVYRRMKRAAFAARYESAMEEAADRLELECRRRAVEGWDEPVYQGGMLVGMVRKFSDPLLIFLTRGARPEKYRERQDMTSGGQRLDSGPKILIIPREPAEIGLFAAERLPAVPQRLIPQEPTGDAANAQPQGDGDEKRNSGPTIITQATKVPAGSEPDLIYEPRGGLRDHWWDRSREIVFSGPAGTGKTRGVLERLNLLAEKYPGMRGLIARKTRSSMTQSAMVTFEGKVLRAGHPALSGAARANRSSYRYPNGSEIVVGGLDRPDRIMSTEYDLICVCEATETTLEDWEKLSTRLRNGKMPWQQMVADVNPVAQSHWIYQRMASGKAVRVDTFHRDNPYLWDREHARWTAAGSDYISRLDQLTGVRRKRLLEGTWAAAEGLVYEDFARWVRRSEDYRLPDGMFRSPSPAVRVVCGLDWGWRDPTAVLVGVEGQDGVLRIVEEIYESHLPLEELAQRLSDMGRNWGIEQIFCDPARPEVIDHIRGSGLPLIAHKIRKIDTGIAMVSGRMRRGELHVWDTCPKLIRESDEYEWARDAKGNPREAPVDKNNHAMDALRYLVCGLDWQRSFEHGKPEVATTEEEDRQIDRAQQTETARRQGLPDPEEDRQREAEEGRRRREEMQWGDEGWE